MAARDPRAFMGFLSRVSAVLADYSREELLEFGRMATRSYPALADLVDAALRMGDQGRESAPVDQVRSAAEESTELPQAERSGAAQARVRQRNIGSKLEMLLSSRSLFPTNDELVQFAMRTVPGMSRSGLAGKGRSFVVRRIVAQIAKLDPERREEISRALQQAVDGYAHGAFADPQSFFSQWEKIIKGMGRQ